MGSAVDLAGSGLLCCSSLPSDIFISNWRGCNYTPLHLRRAWKSTWKRTDAAPWAASSPPSLLCLSSGVAGPTVPAGPGGYNTHPILYSAYFAIKRAVFPFLLQKFTQRLSTGDCGISMYWRLAAGSYTFVILCSGLQRESKRAYYANGVLFS